MKTLKDLIMYSNDELLAFFELDICPTWATWLAVDIDGLVTFFDAEPEMHCGYWQPAQGRGKFYTLKLNDLYVRIYVADFNLAKVSRQLQRTIENNGEENV